jgi:histidine triad (HIT) family protein
MAECPFCELIKDTTTSHTVYEDTSFIVILDKESLGIGHCMIIPKIHVSKIYELDDKTYIELFKFAKKLSGILKVFPQEKNYRSFANTGGLSPIENAVAYTSFGTGIQHAHLHLIPHNNPEVLLNPAKYIKKLSDKEIEKNAEIIRNLIKGNL